MWRRSRTLFDNLRVRFPRLGVHIEQGVKFCMVGVLGAVVDLSVLTLAVRLLGMLPEYAVILSTFLALCCVFLTNKHFTFRTRKGKTHVQLMRFIAARVVSFLLNIGLSILFIRLGVFYIFARVFAILTVMTWNYVLLHTFVFVHREELE